MSHTPGPWTVVTSWDNYIYVHTEKDDQLVCGEIGSQANAHLIAAAPELYDVLEDILINYDRPGPEELTPTWTRAAQALKKAKGEA